MRDNEPDLILNPGELKLLTGTSQSKRQCAWLTDRGWMFEAPARRGDRPKVDRTYYLARMSGQVVSGGARAKPRFGVFGGK